MGPKIGPSESGFRGKGAPEILARAVRQMKLYPMEHPDALLHSKRLPLHPGLLSVSDSAITLTENLEQFSGVRRDVRSVLKMNMAQNVSQRCAGRIPLTDLSVVK